MMINMHAVIAFPSHSLPTTRAGKKT